MLILPISTLQLPKPRALNRAGAANVERSELKCSVRLLPNPFRIVNEYRQYSKLGDTETGALVTVLTLFYMKA